jgi:DNA replication and repair protein RecF
VRLTTLALRCFRNLRSQELEVPAEGVALVGDNAQGKSNFLEAIYYLETLRSFRGARDNQMLAFDADVFRVVGTTEAEGDDERRGVEVAAAYQKKGKRKKVTIDGAEPERLSDALGHLSAVIFSPADVDLVSGGPAERRRFLDIVLSLNEPGYLTALQNYRKSLVRRNASLKAGDPASLVSVWNDGLVRAGAEVMVARQSWVADRRDAFGTCYRKVSAGEAARMTYRPSVPLPDDASPEASRAAFTEALADSAERERRMGVTVVGPHRDDVRLQLESEDTELDLRDYGSGGQRRTAALALRLVEAQTIRDRRSRKPLILLDDVFAELDGGRSERILELMDTDETGQVVLTAPKEADVRLRSDRLTRWRIRAGEIST